MASWSKTTGWKAINLADGSPLSNKLNQWSANAVKYFANSVPGQYTRTRDNLPTEELNELVSQGLLSQKEANNYIQSAKDSFKTFYQETRITPWSSSLGVQPPGGKFDSSYYSMRYPDAAKAWKDAVANDDIDITSRYTKDTFLMQDYTQRHLSGEADLRTSAEQPLIHSAQYEEKLTDAEYQQYRDKILGITPGKDTGTALEQQFQKAIDYQDAQKQQVFGALTTDVLKQSLNEIKAAKQKETTISLMNQLLPGYSEIQSINSSVVDSLLGDIGAGGVLAFGNPSQVNKESLEKKISGFTGVPSSNSVLYNWQKWFDNTLTKRYQEGVTIQDPQNAEKQYQIDKDFATKFINDYLKPRFDASRSMDEFVSYIDVMDGEQNIFQTQKVHQSQSALDALKTFADTRAKAYLDGIKNQSVLNFNSEFYFNPTGNEEKAGSYAKQSQEVASDWEAAKKGDAFWKEKAYQYGIDVNNKDQFARLHYEVKGVTNGYDAAKDVITLKDAENYISNKIIPAVIDKQIALNDTTFLKLVTPDEFANQLLAGVDPSNKTEWNKILEQFKLSDSVNTIEEAKGYITEALRTGSAQDIRDSIKYLNEKKVTPTQQELGITYIQRPEDVKTESSKYETSLYSIFKKAGYQGSEDSFYTDFMPDVDREEQVALTKAGKGVAPMQDMMDFSNPISALGSMENFFSMTEDSTLPKATTTTTTSSDEFSYSKLFEDEEETPSKSSAGEKILGEFTSFLKGFK